MLKWITLPVTRRCLAVADGLVCCFFLYLSSSLCPTLSRPSFLRSASHRYRVGRERPRQAEGRRFIAKFLECYGNLAVVLGFTRSVEVQRAKHGLALWRLCPLQRTCIPHTHTHTRMPTPVHDASYPLHINRISLIHFVVFRAIAACIAYSLFWGWRRRTQSPRTGWSLPDIVVLVGSLL